ncbi:hypothetical protein [Aliikangiella coralliicola]|nr:hypothetical protein [Aliikangiella coralliicola]
MQLQVNKPTIAQIQYIEKYSTVNKLAFAGTKHQQNRWKTARK